jgi:hypothetical protein
MNNDYRNGYNGYNNGYNNNYNGYNNGGYNPYGQNPYGQNPYGNGAPQAPQTHSDDTERSFGFWIKTLLLTCLPLVQLFWLFGASKYKTRVSYARAIFTIGVVASIVVVILFYAVLRAMLSGLGLGM